MQREEIVWEHMITLSQVVEKELKGTELQNNTKWHIKP